ncbi:uncharacterized protein TRIVIDRAFT_24027, partial [Trichoderma virens Gv29-8]
DTLATSPCDLERAAALLDQIASFTESKSTLNEEQRVRLVKMAQELTFSLQTPMERILQHSWAEPTVFAAIETASQLNIFRLLGTCTETGNPMTVAQLSEKTGADQILLSRLMKHLSAMGIIEEAGPDQYRSNNMSLVLSAEKFAAAFPYMRRGSILGILQLPDYLAANNYINPTDLTNGPFQFANKTSENWFEWAPKQGNGVFKDFSNHMGTYNSGRPKWVDPNFYPVREQLIDGFMAEVSDQGAVMLVDVGGSLGHDIELFLKQFPNNPGRLILQDLPDVIKQARSI